MTRRAQRAVGQRRVWLRDLAQAARHAYPTAPADRPRELAAFVAACPPFEQAFVRAARSGGSFPSVERWYTPRTVMGPARWPVARLDTVEDLQDLVGHRLSDLLWLADSRRLETQVTDQRLRHYRYRWILKRSGGARLIEEPKPLLKHVQRVILREILNHVPPHDAAHGFRPGRSAVSYARVHVGQQLVIHLDIEDFFGTVTSGRVYGIFRACGYPEPVAHLLTSLTTNSVPPSVWEDRPGRPTGALTGSDFRLGRHLRHPHLPQGAPTSPAIANLAAYRLDLRLHGLAVAAGVRYTRYADDVAFSSDHPLRGAGAERLVQSVEAIIGEEGFRVNPFKTFFQRASQRQLLAGVVVNNRPNVKREDYDTLKAILHNCAEGDPAGQNRSGHPDFPAHLLGRISRVQQLNPARGDRLLAVYHTIPWTSTVSSS